MNKIGFFAYPSDPPDCGEVIENAIKTINGKEKEVEVRSWKQLQIGGSLIISVILQQIEKSDFFCADITGLNENVLFELGFAVGKKKPIFIIQDTTITEAYSKYKEFVLLTGIGHHPYTNSNQIISGFDKERPYDGANILLDNLLQNVNSTENKFALLYLKNHINTNYSQYIDDKIEQYKLPVVTDDPIESKIQPVSWYLQKLLSVPAVLVEFSQLFRTGHHLHNAKCSFVSGLALGLGLRIQMIAAKPYPTTLDYQEYLKKYTNTETFNEAVDPFLSNLKTEIAQLLVASKILIPAIKRESNIQKIRFGEYIAEHESTALPHYYQNTAHYESILKSEYNIVVGRKGSGKTATLYYLQAHFSIDVRNVIVPIKPVNFEIDGLVELIRKLSSEFEKGYIIQSIWKFLIYTEIAKIIFEKIKDKPTYALGVLDKEICDFVLANEQIILSDFSTRLEQELIDLEVLVNITEQSAFRTKISEILHENIIGRLKELIVSYMLKRNKLIVIIDNLDKNWSRGKDFEIISKFILGLLSVVGRVAKELKGNPKKPNDFNLHLLVLLRSDIFTYILKYAREPDKIEYTLLKWDDSEVLFRLTDTRLEYLSEPGIHALNFWEKYVVPRVSGTGTKKFIISCIIPRPRDLIFFLSSAKSKAVSRGHVMIIEDDFIAAYHEYSTWVFQSLLVENGISFNQMETFLFNTIGENSILAKSRIIEIMAVSDIEVDPEDFIDFLCSISFIGREVRLDDFDYQYDLGFNIKSKILAEKLNSERLKIHNAFIPFLECSDYVKSIR